MEVKQDEVKKSMHISYRNLLMLYTVSYTMRHMWRTEFVPSSRKWTAE